MRTRVDIDDELPAKASKLAGPIDRTAILNDRPGARVAEHPADERAVDLQLVDREAPAYAALERPMPKYMVWHHRDEVDPVQRILLRGALEAAVAEVRSDARWRPGRWAL